MAPFDIKYLEVSRAIAIVMVMVFLIWMLQKKVDEFISKYPAVDGNISFTMPLFTLLIVDY